MTDENNGVDFTGFDIKQKNIALAWDKMMAKLELDKLEKEHKKKIEMPKIEAYAVVDEDFERMWNERRKKEKKTHKLIRLTEWGEEYTAKEVDGCTIIFKDRKTGEIDHACIYIRASFYPDNKEKFYEILEHELRHVLLGGGMAAYRHVPKTK